MLFKACTRCRGDLYREEDMGHTDLVCLQCGFRLNAERTPVFNAARERINAVRRPPVSLRPVRAAA